MLRLKNNIKMTAIVCSFCLLAATSAMAQDQPAAGGEPAGGLGITPNAAVAPAVDEGSLTQKASYILGYNQMFGILQAMKSQGVEMDKQAMLDGAKKAIEGEEFDMSKEEIQAVMKAFQEAAMKKMEQKMANASETNKAEGEALLAATAKKEGVQKLENGVLYEVLKTGTGATPTESDVVKIHYHGMFADGTVFDSSVDRGEPLDQMSAGQFVKGFSSALQAMKVGDKWRITIPSELAYGMNADPSIGPNRTLIFELELLDVIK